MASTSKIIGSKICRICMVNVNLQPISKFQDEFDNETIDLSHKLKICCNVDVNLEDKMPKHICKLCFDVLTAAYDLVMLCKQTDDTLRKYIGVDGRIQGTEKTNRYTKYSEESDYCDVEYLSDSDGEYKPDIIHEKSVNVIRNDKQIHLDTSSKNIHSNKIQNINNMNNLKEDYGFQKNIPMSQDMQRNFKFLKQKIHKTCSINKSIVLNNTIQQSPESRDSKQILTNTLNNPLSHGGREHEYIPVRYSVSLGGKKLLMEPVNNSESHDDQKTVKKPKRYLISLGEKKILIKSWNRLIACDPTDKKSNNVDSKTHIKRQNQSDMSQESSNDMSQESNNDMSQESSNNMSQESSYKMSQESSYNMSQESSYKMSQESSNYNMSQESSNNMSQESSNNMSRESSNNMSQESSNNMSQKSSNNTSSKKHTGKIKKSLYSNEDEDFWKTTFIPSKKKRQPHRDDWLCEKCAYYNTNKQLFLQHARTHEPKTIKQCPLCPFKTTYQGSFVGHMRHTHMGVPLKQCDKCPFSTTSKSGFHSHMKRHSGERRYSCTLCNYRTYNNGNLKIHMLKHSNERMFKCDVCGVDYKGKRQLKVHIMRAHLSEKYLRCVPCRRSYLGKESFDAHMKKHAQNQILSPAIKKRYKSKTTKGRKVDREQSYDTHSVVDNMTENDKSNIANCRVVDSFPNSTDKNNTNAGDITKSSDWDSIVAYATDIYSNIRNRKKFNVVHGNKSK